MGCNPDAGKDGHRKPESDGHEKLITSDFHERALPRG
jgi:hypothetical protein